MKIFEISKYSDATLATEVSCSVLDYPQSGKIFDETNGVLRISGWVLACDPDAQVSVIASGPGGSRQIPLTIMRPDVIKRVGFESTHSQCGFQAKVDVGSTIDLQIQIDGCAYPWRQINLLPIDPELYQRIPDTWSAYCHDRLGDITPSDAKVLESLEPGIAKAMILNLSGSGRSMDDISRSKRFTDVELTYLPGFFRDITAPDLCANLVGTALDFGECRLSNPFGVGHASCRESLTSGNATCLRFVSPSGEIFFVFQQVTSADAVYFPCRDFVIFLQYIAVTSIDGMLYHILSHFSNYLDYARKRSAHRFLGVVAYHGSPYHFYYDAAPGMHMLAQHKLLEALPAIVLAQGGDYFSFRTLYGLSCDETTKTWPQIEADALINAGFFVHVGIPFSQQNRSHVESFDRMLARCAETSVDEATAAEVQAARGCFPLVWFGITGQKRAWIEQVDAAVEIFSELAKAFPGIGIVFDGWTSPLNPTDLDKAEAENDNSIVRQIISRLPKTVKTVSVVGANTIRKLAFASSVDFFIANYAAGSIHVSRFSQKPGIGHLNTQMPLNLYIHKSAIFVPAEFVRDIPDPTNPRIDYTSYSIDWKVIYKLVLGLMIEKSLIQQRLVGAGVVKKHWSENEVLLP